MRAGRTLVDKTGRAVVPVDKWGLRELASHGASAVAAVLGGPRGGDADQQVVDVIRVHPD